MTNNLTKSKKDLSEKEFFWQHMLNDLKTLGKILNRNKDEIFVLLHLICFNFLKTSQNTEKYEKCNFSEKLFRNDWETEFNKLYINPMFSSLDENLKRANDAILKGNSNETKKSNIYFMAYEIMLQSLNKASFTYEKDKYWKFRPFVSFKTMSIEFVCSKENRNNYSTLNKFIELKSKLERINNLSEMIALIKFLNSQKISTYKAHSKSIGEYLNKSINPGKSDFCYNYNYH